MLLHSTWQNNLFILRNNLDLQSAMKELFWEFLNQECPILNKLWKLQKKTFQTGKSAHSCPSSVVTAELALVFYAPHTERNVCTNQITLFISLYLFFCSCVRGRRKNWCTPCCCCCYGWLCWCCFSLLQEKLQQVSNFKRFYKIIASLLFYFQITLFKLSISTASKCTETMKCKLKSP